jgi:hypothetical protein
MFCGRIQVILQMTLYKKPRIKLRFEIRNNGIQVFLHEYPFGVNCQKTSKEVLYGNKKYFWNLAKELNATNSKELTT